MTRDDVIRLAREAGVISSSPFFGVWENHALQLERFAHLVIAEFLQRNGRYVTNDASREAAITEALAPWKSAVIDQLVIAHILTAEHESDPLKAIQDLLAYHSDIAVDPRVSGAAEKLVEQAKAEVESAATERANERANASWTLMCEKMVAAERDAILADVVAPILAGCTVSKYATSRECASAREMAKAIDAAIRARGENKP